VECGDGKNTLAFNLVGVSNWDDVAIDKNTPAAFYFNDGGESSTSSCSPSEELQWTAVFTIYNSQPDAGDAASAAYKTSSNVARDNRQNPQSKKYFFKVKCGSIVETKQTNECSTALKLEAMNERTDKGYGTSVSGISVDNIKFKATLTIHKDYEKYTRRILADSQSVTLTIIDGQTAPSSRQERDKCVDLVYEKSWKPGESNAGQHKFVASSYETIPQANAKSDSNTPVVVTIT
jgi:hypothetical protein